MVPKLVDKEDKGERKDGRRQVLATFVNDFTNRGRIAEPSLNHPRSLLDALHKRQDRVLEGLGGGITHEAKLESRLTVGLGGPHPSEVGFTFDRSVGVPFLPGSSVKGLCRAANEIFGIHPELHETLFGPAHIDADDPASIGDLVFFDAYPTRWPTLELDVLNSHHPAYYGGKSSYPAETENPIPIYFLAVARGTAWTFRVRSRSGKYTGQALEVLQTALIELGAGAKTAVGYGAFEPGRAP
ncbi:MAG: type III-B CRISPR module RAMP protein Cmr6 [Byssovorax sp.]